MSEMQGYAGVFQQGDHDIPHDFVVNAIKGLVNPDKTVSIYWKRGGSLLVFEPLVQGLGRDRVELMTTWVLKKGEPLRVVGGGVILSGWRAVSQKGDPEDPSI